MLPANLCGCRGRVDGIRAERSVHDQDRRWSAVCLFGKSTTGGAYLLGPSQPDDSSQTRVVGTVWHVQKWGTRKPTAHRERAGHRTVARQSQGESFCVLFSPRETNGPRVECREVNQGRDDLVRASRNTLKPPLTPTPPSISSLPPAAAPCTWSMQTGIQLPH